MYIHNTHQAERKVYDIIKKSIKKYNTGCDKKTIVNDNIIKLEKYSKKISSITGDNSIDNIYVLANVARLYYESGNPEKARTIINNIDTSYILAYNHNDSNDCALCSYNLVKGLIYQLDKEYSLSDDCFKKIKNHINPSNIYNDIFYQQAMVNLMKNAYTEPKSYVDIANIVNEYSNLIHTIQAIEPYPNMNPAYNICNIDFLIYETLWRRDNDMEYMSLLNCLNIWYDYQSPLFSSDSKIYMYFLTLGTPLSSKYKNIVINEVDMDETVCFHIESLYNMASNNASFEEKEEYINNLYRLNINADTIYTLKYLNALVILYMSYDKLESAYNNLILMQDNINMLDYDTVNTIKAQKIIIDFNYLFYIYYNKINDEQAIQYYNKAETIYKKIYNTAIPENYLMKYMNTTY